MKKQLKTLWIVIPCFNEARTLIKTYTDFVNELHKMKNDGLISANSIIVFVDDGSSDATWNIIEDISNEINDVHGIKLNRNYGQFNALMAGLVTAKESYADAVVTIDCDGQDDVSCISEMVEKFNQGADIVYGVRNNRDSDSAFKRTTAVTYYKLMRLFDKSIVYNHSEFRLMSYNVLEYLDGHGELNPFLRKICAALSHNGMPSDYVYYARKSRAAGDTHYSISALIKCAIIGFKPVHNEIRHVPHDGQYQIETIK